MATMHDRTAILKHIWLIIKIANQQLFPPSTIAVSAGTAWHNGTGVGRQNRQVDVFPDDRVYFSRACGKCPRVKNEGDRFHFIGSPPWTSITASNSPIQRRASRSAGADPDRRVDKEIYCPQG